jgi:hypothetical protein
MQKIPDKSLQKKFMKGFSNMTRRRKAGHGSLAQAS